MRRSAVLLCELCHMAGSPYRPAELQEISWRDLEWLEIKWGASRVPVREEIIEDEAGVISSVVVPTLASDPGDAMETGGIHELGGPLIVAHIDLVLYHYQSAIRITVFLSFLGGFLNSLVGKMESKERECEEN